MKKQITINKEVTAKKEWQDPITIKVRKEERIKILRSVLRSSGCMGNAR